MRIFRLIRSILDRLFILAGAFLGSQVPEFLQQYRQRLSGHVEELGHLMQKLSQMAALSDKTLDQYIAKFLASTDPDFVRQGEFMQSAVTRWQDLSVSLQSLTESAPLTRLYYFFKHLNYSIADSTVHAFQPGINLSIEGLCYTGIGIAAGFLTYQVLEKLISLVCSAMGKKVVNKPT